MVSKSKTHSARTRTS